MLTKNPTIKAQIIGLVCEFLRVINFKVSVNKVSSEEYLRIQNALNRLRFQDNTSISSDSAHVKRFQKKDRPTMRDYLRQFSEPTPDWLKDGDFSLQHFFESRTVFYPGAGNDGHALATFNVSRVAHCYVYVDYNYDENFMQNISSNEQQTIDADHDPLDWYHRLVRGYGPPELKLIDPVELSEETGGDQSLPIWFNHFAREPVDPMILLAIYDRLPEFSDSHGGLRIAVLYVRAEANALYQALFARLFPNHPPFAVLLEDYGFGQNTKSLRFRNPHGPMASVVQSYGKPKFLLAERDKEIWENYARVHCPEELGGMHSISRSLYEYVADSVKSPQT